MGGKTSNESKRKYNEKTYDRIQLVVKKGKKDEIKAFAESHGYTLNSFVNEAIDDKIRSFPSAGDSLPSRAAEAPPAPEVSEEIPTAPEDSKTVEELELSIRTYNAVKRAGCDTVGQLRVYMNSEKCIFSEGGRAYKEIAEALNIPLCSEPSTDETAPEEQSR